MLWVVQGHLKVAKAGLQGAASPLPEREVSSQKLFFPVFRVSPAATHEKQDVSDRMPRLLNGPGQETSTGQRVTQILAEEPLLIQTSRPSSCTLKLSSCSLPPPLPPPSSRTVSCVPGVSPFSCKYKMRASSSSTTSEIQRMTTTSPTPAEESRMAPLSLR